MIIYLDLDGVCSNFIKSAITANNLDYEKTISIWKTDYLGEFSAFKVFGISNKIFWKNINKLGEKFWSEMETYEWFHDLYNSLLDFGKVIFLTTPSQEPESHSGKIKWLQEHFGKNFRDYILTPKKELLASEDSILIDDCPKNIDKFIKHGGNAILFPQFWNNKLTIENKINFTIDKIKELYDPLMND